MRVLSTLLPLLLTATIGSAQNAFFSVDGKACPGSNEKSTTISHQGLPKLGATFRVDLADAPANTMTFMVVGNEVEGWGRLSLPLDLRPYGARGCMLYTNIVHAFQTKTDAVGKASCPLTVPNDRSLLRARIYVQYAVRDLRANLLGMTTSPFGTAGIGN